jgi:hypothetical protein
MDLREEESDEWETWAELNQVDLAKLTRDQEEHCQLQATTAVE